MAQVIENTPRWQERLGTGIGTGLGSVLERLASNKLQKMERQQEQAEFANLLKNRGYSPEEAALVAGFPAEKRLEALLNRFKGEGLTENKEQTQQVQQEQNLQLQQLLQRSQGLEQKPEPLSALELLKSGQQAKLMPGLQEKLFQQQQGPEFDFQQLQAEAARQGLKLSPEQQNLLNSRIQEIYSDQGKRKELEDDVMKYLQSHPEMKGQQQTQPKSVAKPEQDQPLFKKPLTETDKIAQKRLEVAERKEAREEKLAAYKLTQNERKEINDRVKIADQNLHELNRLDELENENLESAGYYEFLKRSGLDIPALMNPASQEYDKISTGFVRNGKAIFGNRITDNDLGLLLKLIPTLSMTPEGRKRVRADLKYFSLADKAYGQTAQEIIKENKGIPPYDLTEQINERIGKKLDVLSNQFKKDLKKPVPEGQNKIITAIQAVLGNAAGAVPGALKGAAKGAIVGSAVPALGTGTGAILGALGGGTGIL